VVVRFIVEMAVHCKLHDISRLRFDYAVGFAYA